VHHARPASIPNPGETGGRESRDASVVAVVSPSGYTPSMDVPVDVAVADSAHTIPSARSTSGESLSYDSDVASDFVASKTRGRRPECLCLGQHRSLEQQLQHFQSEVIHELRNLYQRERKERKRERKHDMRASSRQLQQLQECVLTLTS
jgi:hypothetical protein